ncbi:Type I restriction-modification system, specificity subunit S [thiotrophic endosymbiont of Bathymodiolus puteoserpentis (Logatchev)]|nr:Type I restriction-modification system, specificity subunit S [thiotrophic endosymbiont of Bathymodiolus puteoserpentis (Logatchev)]
MPVLKIKNVANGNTNHNDVVFHKVSFSLEKYIIKKGDTLIALTGNHPFAKTQVVGGVSKYRLPIKSLLNQRVAKIFSKEKSMLHNEILYYFFKWNNTQFHIGNQSSGSASQANISKNDLLNIPINLPPLPEQVAIAKILTVFDDKIELLQAQNKTLETTAQTIFKEWFGKYQIGDELPDGWRVGKLSEIADFLNGLALQKYPPIAGEETLPVIKIRELKQGITSNTDKANTLLNEKYIINNGDVLFSWSGSLEVVIWKYGRGALNQHLFKVSSENYPKWFYYFWTLHHLKEFKNVAANKATTMGHINRRHLDEAIILIPDIMTMNKIGKGLSSVLEKTENNTTQIQTLKKTRDTLLPKLMSGALRVDEFKEDTV